MSNISPVVVDKIKKANGQVRIISEGTNHSIQILMNGSWSTILVNQDRSLCELAISKARSNVILG